MSKKLFAVGITLFFIFSLSSGVFAQIGDFYGLESMLISDWQLDYIRPIEPGKLEKGEYRLSSLVGGMNYGRERDIFNSFYDEYDYDNGTTAYFIVFDTALSDNLTLHSKYAYKP